MPLATLTRLPLLLLDRAYTALGLTLINAPTGPGKAYILSSAAYGPAPWQRMDIYTPHGAPAHNDVIVFFYGGRWSSGMREDYRFVGHALARRGFTVVIPDYSQYPAAKFPGFVEDGALAIAHATQQLKPTRLFVAGHSAGAHIGALLATDPTYNVREHVTAFAGLAGPYSFTPEDADLIDMFGPPERYKLMQATTYIDGQQPPLLLQYGLGDKTVAPYNHERLAARVRTLGGVVDIKTYQGVSHVGMVTAFAWLGRNKQIVADMTAFFTQQPAINKNYQSS